jgi:endonuclease/exonuclease/phosphatase family metal-dependent hydrolase
LFVVVSSRRRAVASLWSDGASGGRSLCDHAAMPVVRVASFNAHWCLHRRGGDIDLMGVFEDLDADVVCLQEVWRRRDGRVDHEVVADKLGYEVVEVRVPREHNKTAPDQVREIDGDRSWWGMALLSRCPVRSVTEHPLGSVFADEAHRVACRVELDVAGTPLGAVFTHLTWRAWGIPKQLRRLRPLLPRATPGFAAGDFNMWGPIVSGALPGWRRAVRGRTWPAPRTLHQLDHILVNDMVRVCDASLADYNGSDHIPVRATLEF